MLTQDKFNDLTKLKFSRDEQRILLEKDLLRFKLEEKKYKSIGTPEFTQQQQKNAHARAHTQRQRLFHGHKMEPMLRARQKKWNLTVK